jgi:hypothetical protein
MIGVRRSRQNAETMTETRAKEHGKMSMLMGLKVERKEREIEQDIIN